MSISPTLRDRINQAYNWVDIYHINNLIDETRATQIRDLIDSPDLENLTVAEEILKNYKL